jgi:hypothetical protein
VLDWRNPTFQSTGIYATWAWSYSVLGLGGLGVVITAYVLHRKHSLVGAF